MNLVIGPDPVLAGDMARIQRAIDTSFDALLPAPTDARVPLAEAMRYAAIGGGKRLRPLLLSATATLHGVGFDSAVRAGTAIEAVHV